VTTILLFLLGALVLGTALAAAVARFSFAQADREIRSLLAPPAPPALRPKGPVKGRGRGGLSTGV
jgi:hypothetical protein